MTSKYYMKTRRFNLTLTFNMILTLWLDLYQSPISKLKSAAGVAYGTGIRGLAYTLIAPKPPAALCIAVDGKYV
ncbi:hypothetical protein HanIR_Chr15g0775911 [Helianthus annuus]|nr:hypothetical protein HanIR_Chr15g0775911 [Helianthus annuus]